VAQWRQSGQSAAEFCRRWSVAPHVLHYWVSRAQVRPVAGAKSPFFVVEAPERQPGPGERSSSLGRAADAMDSAVVIVLPAASPERLAQTVRALLQENGA